MRRPLRFSTRVYVSEVGLAALIAISSSATAVAAPGCHGISATGVAFGPYDPLSATAVVSVGTVSFNCPPPTMAQLSLSAGGSGTFFPRGMSNPADPVRLEYNLYVDAAFTTVWGDGTGGTVSVPVPAKTKSLDVYGRIPPSQDVAVGTFSDTVIVTFNF
jgi:spore coat protein U-like protein